MAQVISLNEESGFNKLVKCYNENREKPWHEWLEFKEVFPHLGKQGLVGLMTVKETGDTFVFKISQYINYLVQHELAVMKSLNNLSDFCPHFCKSIGGIICDVDPTNRKSGNPFILDSSYHMEKEVILMEHIEGSSKLYNYIRSDKVSEDILYSLVKQTLLAVAIAQNKKRFTHYDLHSNNIMVKCCNRNLVFQYILDDQNQFCVATRGYYPVIIDFGFSYVGEMDDGPLWPSLGHTDVGFMSNEYDSIADPKLFLVTVSGEINAKKKSKRSKKLRNITHNIFNSLSIDWSSGWDTDNKKPASDYVLENLEKFTAGSKLFQKFDHYCIDILQSLIILPLQKQKKDNLKTSFITFLYEFAKIEQEISSPFYCLYVLKGIVDSARVVRSDYLNKQTREHAIHYFRTNTYQYIDTVAKFCKPKDINFERMLCSLLCTVRGIERILYDAVSERMTEKRGMYSKLPIKSTEEICAVIDINIEDTYTFTSETTVMVINCIEGKTYTLPLTEENRIALNELASISRGPELYRIEKENRVLDKNV